MLCNCVHHQPHACTVSPHSALPSFPLTTTQSQGTYCNNSSATHRQTIPNKAPQNCEYKQHSTAQVTVSLSVKKMYLFLSSLLLLLLPLPPVGATPAKPCVEADCKLPNCRCASTGIPGGLTPSETPQIVMISFDDGIQSNTYETLYSKFLNGRKNPNGCPVPMTLFLAHYYSVDYALVEDLYSEGHEMEDHSVTHRTPTTWWTSANVSQLTQEIMGMKTILEKWGNVPSKSIVGYRSPFLASSENQLLVLHQNNFTYDCSMPTDGTMYWPFTLDYKSPICTSPATCPTESMPGLWILPNIPYNQTSGIVCSMMDGCVFPVMKTTEEWLEFLTSNFDKHYNGNRAPFGVYAHSAWFSMQGNPLEAFNTFLDKIQSLPEVYIVTQSQMLAWVRSPTPLSKVKAFQPWQCPKRPAPRCSYKDEKTCTYDLPSQQRVFQACIDTCPKCWPDLGDPLGECK